MMCLDIIFTQLFFDFDTHLLAAHTHKENSQSGLTLKTDFFLVHIQFEYDKLFSLFQQQWIAPLGMTEFYFRDDSTRVILKKENVISKNHFAKEKVENFDGNNQKESL